MYHGGKCHATSGPSKIGPPGSFMAATAGPSGPFAALQMVPPDQLWRRGWCPFATAGPPYNPAFISYFLLNHSKGKRSTKFLNHTHAQLATLNYFT